jgi:hypothetical protein
VNVGIDQITCYIGGCRAIAKTPRRHGCYRHCGCHGRAYDGTLGHRSRHGGLRRSLTRGGTFGATGHKAQRRGERTGLNAGNGRRGGTLRGRNGHGLHLRLRNDCDCLSLTRCRAHESIRAQGHGGGRDGIVRINCVVGKALGKPFHPHVRCRRGGIVRFSRIRVPSKVGPKPLDQGSDPSHTRDNGSPD